MSKENLEKEFIVVDNDYNKPDFLRANYISVTKEEINNILKNFKEFTTHVDNPNASIVSVCVGEEHHSIGEGCILIHHGDEINITIGTDMFILDLTKYSIENTIYILNTLQLVYESFIKNRNYKHVDFSSKYYAIRVTKEQTNLDSMNFFICNSGYFGIIMLIEDCNVDSWIVRQLRFYKMPGIHSGVRPILSSRLCKVSNKTENIEPGVFSYKEIKEPVSQDK